MMNFFSLTQKGFFDTVGKLPIDMRGVNMSESLDLATLQVEGVGLVLCNEWEQILFVTEGREKSKYDKRVGDLSIPWETRERDADGNHEPLDRALQRVLDEEVGFLVNVSEAEVFFCFEIFGVRQTIFFARFYDAIRMGGTAIESGEILGYEWLFPGEIISRRLRGGMHQILRAYEEYTACRTISRGHA